MTDGQPIDARPTRWRTFELCFAFGVMPFAIWQLRGVGINVPVIPSVLLFCLWAGVLLWRDRGFDRGVLRRRISRGDVGRILLRAAGVALVLGGYMFVFERDQFLSFPRQRPDIWLLVMTFYPLLSVYPQEVAFRAFFFRRYQPLFGSGLAMVLFSALAFGWAHILFGKAPSVWLSAAGGVLFGLTYMRTQSVLAVWLEHALYGCMIFTFGLGRYFYGGVAAPP